MIQGEDVCLVGDRVLSDILMGNRFRMFTILVNPFSFKGENFVVKFLRKVEARNGFI